MVNNSDAAAIVNSVIGLGRAMGLCVVAEGVESEEQLAMLKPSTADDIRGHLFGKALPAEFYGDIMGQETASSESRAAMLLRDAQAY